jgi:hypothetical protein
MNGFREQILDLQLQSSPNMPPEVHEGRLRMNTITISKINKFEDECRKNCE